MALHFDYALRLRSNSVKTPGLYGYAGVVVHRSASLASMYSFVEAHPFALVNGRYAYGGGQMGFAGAGAADQDQVVGLFHKMACRQLFDTGFLQRRFRPINLEQVTMNGKTGRLELVVEAANLPVDLFSGDQTIQPVLAQT